MSADVNGCPISGSISASRGTLASFNSIPLTIIPLILFFSCSVFFPVQGKVVNCVNSID